LEGFLEGIITVIAIIFAGFIIYEKFGKFINQTIHKTGL